MKRGVFIAPWIVLSTSPLYGIDTAHEIAVLKEQVQTLMQRINELEKNQSAPKPQDIKTTAETAKPAAAPAAQPEPKNSGLEIPKAITTSGNDKVQLRISGHVNRAILYGNNGTNSRLTHVDNANSNSRVRFEGLASLSKKLKLGTNFEAGFSPNSSDSIDLGVGSPNPTTFNARKAEAFVEHDNYGKLSVGHGYTASYEIVQSDLSGTYVMTDGATAEFFAGGITFFNVNGSKGPSIGQVFQGMDGLRRDNRLRYDTPQMRGFKLSSSHVQGDMGDIALRYAGEIAKTQIQGGIAFANDRKGSKSNQTSGSISFLHACGLSLTLGAGNRSYKSFANRKRQGFMGYIKGGYQMKYFTWGPTSVAVDFAKGAHIFADNYVTHIWGAYLVQNVDPAATELFIGARKHQLFSPGQRYKDIFAVMSGARIKF
ncbi:porin [Candidatus Nucleicultrix amoebiphila]|jgi:predicted porin|uniref:Porin domain-containing protein n=1 Tax=Candidatus Nucleicultrix amoebiphila FS5 TaxID=1414854 RepID=A0A1W6N517_9PROT|nr:hypothetical protein [Candidatus Nucleicultrix amoebiphila]ARN84912.1 hypothetical protein GQ61_06005 [Candidatus Nucleicultrix amoebiphila FS5]